MEKIKAAIIGSGNIGTDLLIKARRSEWIDPIWLVGIDKNSEGLKRARSLGVTTTDQGVTGILPFLKRDNIKIAFDATSAHAHLAHSQSIMDENVLMIDLTPAAIGPFCVPCVNLKDQAQKEVKNVNMVSCGGQATIPMVRAVSRVQPVAYGEIIATVSSASVGPGTRQNIDEFTRTTARGIETVGFAEKGKAIIIINPANPPIIMRDTIHCLTEKEPQQDAIKDSINKMVEEVARYVPGYRLLCEPIFEGKRVSIHIEVKGLGDFLPEYAGNLDIMTAAALRTSEMYAAKMLGIKGV